MSRLTDLQRQMRSNVATLRNETLSAAINLLVEYLQTSGQLKRTSSATEASSNEK